MKKLLQCSLFGILSSSIPISATPINNIESLERRAGIFANTQLRILPLGDSITHGSGSLDGNSYRQKLFDALDAEGAVIEMIGSLAFGNMSQPKNEGHSGATIAQISNYSTSLQALPLLPNVVVLHAGTNDMNKPDVDTAYQRLFDLVNKIRTAVPDAVILVAQIINSKDPARQPKITAFNAALRSGLAKATNNDNQVILVDQYSALNISDSGDYNDDLHPRMGGYAKMAKVWYAGLVKAQQAKLIKSPSNFKPSSSDGSCTVFPSWYNEGRIATGGGMGRNYFPGTTCTAKTSNSCTCDHGDGTSEVANLVGTGCSDMSTPYTTALHFADVDGDGRAEFLFVLPNGDVRGWRNGGSKDGSPNVHDVRWWSAGVIASGLGNQRGQIAFADINGDGRADYLQVHLNGTVEAWLNEGSQSNSRADAIKVTWKALGAIATGQRPGAGIRFADLNGDGRADYLFLDAKVGTTAFINGGFDGSKVSWINQGVITSSFASRENIYFSDINGDGRADFLYISHIDGTTSQWLNAGGPSDLANAGKVRWIAQGQVATGFSSSNGTSIVFVDMNGDKRADMLDVDPLTSAVVAKTNGC